MKYICIAPNTDSFAWQVDLSYHQHLSLGFSASDFIVLSPGYLPSESKFPSYIKIISTKNWNEYLNKPHNLFYEPINIQTSLMQMEFLDEEIYILGEPDIFLLFKNINLDLSDCDIIHESIYEDWHLKLQSDNSHYKSLVSNDFSYSGGGPWIMKGSTMKKILPDWTDYHFQCADNANSKHEQWWAGMYAYNLACAKNNIKVSEKRICCIPALDSKITKDMFCLHYSVNVGSFNKKEGLSLHTIFEMNLDLSTQSELFFFNVLKNWLAKSTFAKNIYH